MTAGHIFSRRPRLASGSMRHRKLHLNRLPFCPPRKASFTPMPSNTFPSISFSQSFTGTCKHTHARTHIHALSEGTRIRISVSRVENLLGSPTEKLSFSKDLFLYTGHRFFFLQQRQQTRMNRDDTDVKKICQVARHLSLSFSLPSAEQPLYLCCCFTLCCCSTTHSSELLKRSHSNSSGPIHSTRCRLFRHRFPSVATHRFHTRPSEKRSNFPYASRRTR